MSAPGILRALRRDTDGSSAMSLLVMAPLLLLMTTMGFDLGLLMVRGALLERAVDVQIREIRLGLRANTDYAGLRKAICDEAKIIPHCETRLKLQLKAMSPFSWQDPGQTPDCESLKEITLTNPREFDAAQGNQLVVLRACAVLEPVAPTWGLGDILTKAADGSRNRFYQITASTSYTMEP